MKISKLFALVFMALLSVVSFADSLSGYGQFGSSGKNLGQLNTALPNLPGVGGFIFQSGGGTSGIGRTNISTGSPFFDKTVSGTSSYNPTTHIYTATIPNCKAAVVTAVTMVVNGKSVKKSVIVEYDGTANITVSDLNVRGKNSTLKLVFSGGISYTFKGALVSGGLAASL